MANASEFLQVTQAEQVRRSDEPIAQHDDQRCSTGNYFCLTRFRSQERDRFIERLRLQKFDVWHGRRVDLFPFATLHLATFLLIQRAQNFLGRNRQVEKMDPYGAVNGIPDRRSSRWYRRFADPV